MISGGGGGSNGGDDSGVNKAVLRRMGSTSQPSRFLLPGINAMIKTCPVNRGPEPLMSDTWISEQFARERGIRAALPKSLVRSIAGDVGVALLAAADAQPLPGAPRR